MLKEQNEQEEMQKKAKQLADKRKAEEIEEDYLARRELRRKRESEWVLCGKFMHGEQYYDVLPSGDVTEEEKRYFWQSRRVFNRIAPTLDASMAKLVKAIPQLKVRAFSEEEEDVQTAKLATGILQAVKDKLNLQEELEKATLWAEVCGSVFYKIVWDDKAGRQVGVDQEGAPVYEGEVSVLTTSPFEIFPDDLGVENLQEVKSLIHAKVVPATYVFEKFGVAVTGERVEMATLDGTVNQMKDGVVYIERYTKPCQAYPKGKVEIVCSGELLYEGELPYVNGDGGARTFPFVKQDCLPMPGSFFGRSVVDRLIPLQRAYNAVRNRKHEFLNRATFGVLTVEDGSLDTDELADEGLAPGRVLVYRQGGTPPKFLEGGDLPAEFAKEEEWLEKEFAVLSGVRDYTQKGYATSVTSATGLQLLLSQEESRLQNTVTAIGNAAKEIGRQILRLYKQFAGSARLIKITGENAKTQAVYFNANDLRASDVAFESEAILSVEEKRETLLRLYEAGILQGADGKVSVAHKNSILESFGLETLDASQDLSKLHVQKAAQENLTFALAEVKIDDYDDHALHEAEHVKYLISLSLRGEEGEAKRRAEAHLRAHREKNKEK